MKSLLRPSLLLLGCLAVTSFTYAQLRSTKTAIDFGSVRALASRVDSFYVKNDSSFAQIIDEVFTRTSQFTVAGVTNYSLASRDSVKIRVTFRPDLIGTFRDTVYINSHGPTGERTLKVSLTGRGVDNIRFLSATTSAPITSLALVDTFARATRRDSLVLINDATYPITVNAMVFSNSEFQVLTSFPLLLSFGIPQKVVIAYRGNSVGRDRDTLLIYHDDPAIGSSPLRFPVTARALGNLHFSVGGVILDNFDTLRVSSTSAGTRNGSLNPPVPIDSTRTGAVSIRNRGVSTVTVQSISMTGPQFQNITPANYEHRVGDAYDRIINFTFRPRTLGSLFRDSLVVITNDTIPGGNRMVLLVEGASTRQVHLRNAANATSLAFGTVALGNTSTQIARLYNFRDLPLAVDSIRFAVRDPKYSIVSTSTMNLAAGDTSFITLRFAPTDTLPTFADPHRDTLLVYASAWSSAPLRLPLSGTVGQSILFSPASTTFNMGDVRIGLTKDTTIKVFNFTTTAYRLDSLALVRGRDFIILSNVLTTPLPVRDSTVIEVQFKPTVAGEILDTLLIYHNFPTNLVSTRPRRVALRGYGSTQQLIDPANYSTVDNAAGIDGFPISSPDSSYYERGAFWQNRSAADFGGTATGHRRSPNLAGSNVGSEANWVFNVQNSGPYLIYHYVLNSPNIGGGMYVHFRKFGIGGIVDSIRYNQFENRTFDPRYGGTWKPLMMHWIDGVGPGAARLSIGADERTGGFLRVDAVRLLRSQQKADIEFGRRGINFDAERVWEEFPDVTLGDEVVRPMRLYNLGTDTLVITNIRFFPAELPTPRPTAWFSAKNFTPGTPIKIPPMRMVGSQETGGYFDLQVAFGPFEEGVARDSLVITSNDESEPNAYIILTGEGINYNFIMNASLGGTEPHFRAPAPPEVPTFARYFETANGSWLNSTLAAVTYPIPGGNLSSRVNVGGAATLPHQAFYEFELPEIALGKIRTDGRYLLEYGGPAGSPNGYSRTLTKVTHSFGVPPDSAFFSATTPANHLWLTIGGSAKTFFMSPGGKVTVEFARTAATDAGGGVGVLRTDLLRIRKVPTGALIGVDVAQGAALDFGEVNFRNPGGIDGRANKRNVLIGSRGETQLTINTIRLRDGQFFRMTNPPATPAFLRAISGELRVEIEFLPNRIATGFVDTLEIRSNSTRDSLLLVPLVGAGVGSTFTVNDDGQAVEVYSVPPFGGLYTGRWDPARLNNWQLESSNTPNQIGIGQTRRRLPIYLNPTGAYFEWYPQFDAVQGSDSMYVQVFATVQQGLTNASPAARYKVYAAGGVIRKDTIVNQNAVTVGRSGLGEINLGNFYFLRGGRDVANQPSIFGRVRLENDTAAVNRYYRDRNQINIAQRDTFGLIADAVIFRELAAPTGPPTQIVTEETVPREFSLSQNYPNPFNPTTTINFSLPERVRVELKIYDLLGREVATLIDGDEISAGTHRVQWNGRNRFGETVSTGVYFYRIVAGGFVQTKKMVLVK